MSDSPNSNIFDDPGLFGYSDARNKDEADGLREYFLEFPDLAAVREGRKTIIVGRKGTGKTAVRCHLQQATDGHYHMDLSPPPVATHPVFTYYAKALEGGEVPGVDAYEMGWRAFILAQALSNLDQDGLISLLNTRQVGNALRRMNIRQSRQLADRVREISVGLGQVLSATVALDTTELGKLLPTSHELDVLLKLVGKASRRVTRRFMLAVDRVDRQLDHCLPGTDYEQYLRYVCGLCMATGWFNDSISPQEFTVYALVREDLFDQLALRFHNFTEFESLAYRLEWSSESLMDMLALRLSRSLHIFYNPSQSYRKKSQDMFSDNMFHRLFFRDPCDGLPLWTYLLCHTLMRPRDIIQWCNACRNVAKQKRKNICDGHVINVGGFDYSKRRYSDLVSESLYRVTNFKNFVDRFRRQPFEWTHSDLDAFVAQVIRELTVQDIATESEGAFDSTRAMQYLFDIGFLVVAASDETIEQARGGMGRTRPNRLPFLTASVDPYFPISSASTLYVHPAFHKELHRGMPTTNLLALLHW